LNGFTLLRASDLKIALPEKPDERRFIVRKPDGHEQEVVIEIDIKALQAVESVTHRLPLESFLDGTVRTLPQRFFMERRQCSFG
jgi:hypothetical protein